MKIKDGKLIYHLVPLDSLESIIKNGLMSRNDLHKVNIDFIDTADQEILYERQRLDLSQYILFHFHIHTAYDTAVKNNNKDMVFVYICLHRDFAKINGFKILPLHPASNERPALYEYDEGFELIDWNTMELTILDAHNLGMDLRYHKQVRMAECLSLSPISVEKFFSINVPNEDAKRNVIDLLDKYVITQKPFVDIKNWFV